MSPAARSGLIAVGLVAFFVLAGAALVGGWAYTHRGAAGGGVEPAGKEKRLAESAREPAQSALSEKALGWDRRGLADYLIANGFPRLKVSVIKGNTYFLLHRQTTEKQDPDIESMIGFGYLISHTADAVEVSDLGSPKSVRDALRDIGDDAAKDHWGWGKFLFRGHEGDFALLRKALR